MKIKNIHNGDVFKVEYQEWKHEYIEKGKYKNFDILDYSDIIELHSYDKKGNPVFSQVIDRKRGMDVYLKTKDRVMYKELSFEHCDKYLIPLKKTIRKRLLVKIWMNIKYFHNSHKAKFYIALLFLLGAIINAIFNAISNTHKVSNFFNSF